MPNRIEGSSPSLVCDQEPVESQSQTASTSSAVPINRVEQARVEEQAFAEGNPLSGGMVADYLKGIPTPGEAELELGGTVVHNGVRGKVTVKRDEDGEFTITTAGRGQVGLHVGPGAKVGFEGALTWKTRTPEAAADLVTSLGASAAPLVGEFARARVGHYNDESLRQIQLSGNAAAALTLPLPVITGELEVGAKLSGMLDLDRQSLVFEQSVQGEALGRFGALIYGGGIEGEVVGKLRTEVRLPPDAIDQLRNGTMTPADCLKKFGTTQKLIIEGEGRGEVFHAFSTTQSYSRIVKGEVEIDLTKLGNQKLSTLIDDPSRLADIAHGKRTLLTSTDVAGTEAHFMVGEFKAMAARYKATETPLFHGHDDVNAMQKQLDAKRLLNTAPH